MTYLILLSRNYYNLIVLLGAAIETTESNLSSFRYDHHRLKTINVNLIYVPMHS